MTFLSEVAAEGIARFTLSLSIYLNQDSSLLLSQAVSSAHVLTLFTEQATSPSGSRLTSRLLSSAAWTFLYVHVN